jgi:predicted DNA-binding protein
MSNRASHTSRKRVSVALVPGQVERLDYLARHAGVTRLEMLRRILSLELGKRPGWATLH